MKVCTKCKKNKDETCFHKQSSNKKDGLRCKCKECRSKYNKELAIKRNKKRKEEILPDGMKRCANTSCNKILPYPSLKAQPRVEQSRRPRAIIARQSRRKLKKIRRARMVSAGSGGRIGKKPIRVNTKEDASTLKIGD